MITQDYYLHRTENLVKQITITANNAPINTAAHSIEFAVSKEWTTNTLSVLRSSNTAQINVVNANTATIQVNFIPTANAGYNDSNLVYQLRTIRNSDNVITIVQEGRIFIQPSLFD